MNIPRCLMAATLVALSACAPMRNEARAPVTDAPVASASVAEAPPAQAPRPPLRTRQQNLVDRERLATAVERLGQCRAATPADAGLERYYREIKIETPDSANRESLLRSDARLNDAQRSLVYRALNLRRPCRDAYLADLAALPRFADAVSDGIRRSDSAYLRLVEGRLTIGEFNTELERVDAQTRAEWGRLVQALETEETRDDAEPR